MKYSVQEFASKIRKQNPLKYRGFSDHDLINAYLKQFPNDKSKIDFSLKKEGKRFSIFSDFLVPVFIVAIIGITIAYLSKLGSADSHTTTNRSSYTTVDTPKYNESILNENNNESIKSIENESQNGTSENVERNSIASSEDIEIIKKTASELGLPKNETNTLIEILSDPNPDPENKDGNVCGNEIMKCKWCSNEYSVDKEYMSYKSSLLLCINPINGMALAMMLTLKEDELKMFFHALCINYKNGIKYDCITKLNSSKYCSSKCKWEAEHNK